MSQQWMFFKYNVQSRVCRFKLNMLNAPMVRTMDRSAMLVAIINNGSIDRRKRAKPNVNFFNTSRISRQEFQWNIMLSITYHCRIIFTSYTVLLKGNTNE